MRSGYVLLLHVGQRALCHHCDELQIAGLPFEIIRRIAEVFANCIRVAARPGDLDCVSHRVLHERRARIVDFRDGWIDIICDAQIHGRFAHGIDANRVTKVVIPFQVRRNADCTNTCGNLAFEDIHNLVRFFCFALVQSDELQHAQLNKIIIERFVKQ